MQRKISDGRTINFTNISEKIVHINMDDRNELAEAIIRFQEYYESPFSEIRGQIFTLGYLKSLGGRDSRNLNTYCGNSLNVSDWAGYNFPSEALEPFIKGLFDPLTEYEKVIVETLRYREGSFYIIATYGDGDPADAMEHEIRHAMYGTCEKYKKEVDRELAKFKKELAPLKKCLKSWGYHDIVVQDECHAYMGCDHDYFFENFTDDVKKHKINQVPKLRNALNRIAKKYKKELKIT